MVVNSLTAIRSAFLFNSIALYCAESYRDQPNPKASATPYIYTPYILAQKVNNFRSSFIQRNTFSIGSDLVKKEAQKPR